MRSLHLPFAVTLLACSSSSSPAPAQTDAGTVFEEDTAKPVVPPEWDRAVTPPSDDEATTKRASCAYKAGALPAETQGKSRPTGKDIPIDHIVIVMMENRSFDHYFQKGKEAGLDVDVAPADFSNPGADGKPVTIKRDEFLCFVDTNHDWDGVHEQVGATDKMDGFFKSNEGHHDLPVNGTPDLLTGARALTYYEPSDLPFMYWAANNFAIGDKYFCSMLGPTWPNRMYLYAASSFGRINNRVADKVDATIFDRLETRGITWKIYSDLTPGAGVIPDRVVKYREHVVNNGEYLVDAAAGTLPQVVFLDPTIAKERYDQNDEHPPAIMQVGQAWLAKMVDATMKSPLWNKLAFFITYDEHGGLYDHVPPPKACPPDDRLPIGSPAEITDKFDRYGIRVPFVIISPYAKKKFVSHHVYDHTSITRFIEARFTLPAMTNRDANAEAPYDMFDFSKPNPPPAAPPTPSIDEAKKAACKKIYEK